MSKLKIHNAAWPGVVGKDPDTDQPPISLDRMLELTAKAEVNGQKFDGIDLFLFDPHVSIDSSADDLKALADKVQGLGLEIGSLVAPVWEPTGGGSACGSEEERKLFLEAVRKGCSIAKDLRDLGVRPNGLVRIDTSVDPQTWASDQEANNALIIETFKEAGKIAQDHGEKLAAEGEICWGGMHSWRYMLDILEGVGLPETVGFQCDLAHSMLYLLGYNAPEHRLLPEDFDWNDKDTFQAAYKKMADALRPWTLDFHVAQNDGTVHGSGSHDKTGRHCLPNDPNGKLDITWAAGCWLRDENGALLNAFNHICWDGCMFDNAVLENPQTWNDILATMLDVRNAHGE